MIARQGSTANGWVRGEPLRFVRGHQTRKPSKLGTLSERLCTCGCGGFTEWGVQKPLGYINGHRFPWPLCECGCKQETPSRRARFVVGHANLASVAQRYEVAEESGCWVWQGHIQPDGYPRFRIQSRGVQAHRWFYELYKGEIPPKFEVHHVCRNTACVNPEHLEALPREEHTLVHLIERVGPERVLELLERVAA